MHTAPGLDYITSKFQFQDLKFLSMFYHQQYVMQISQKSGYYGHYLALQFLSLSELFLGILE